MVMQADSVAHFQNQRHGELGHGSGTIGGNVGNGYSTGGTGLAVHNVVTCGLDTNQLDIGAGIQYRFRLKPRNITEKPG